MNETINANANTNAPSDINTASDTVRTIARPSNDMLLKWAYIRDYNRRIEKLAEMAEPECWAPVNGNGYPALLDGMLRAEFKRAANEDGAVRFDASGNHATFNTGLRHRETGKAIFALFDRNLRPGFQPFFFKGFCTDGDGQFGAALHDAFGDDLPERPSFDSLIEKAGDFDPSVRLYANYEKLAEHCMHRMPMSLLREALGVIGKERLLDEALAEVAKVADSTVPYEWRMSTALVQAKDAIVADDDALGIIAASIRSAVARALDRIACGSDEALLCYYAKRDSINFGIKLDIEQTGTVDSVLIVAPTRDGDFAAHTILAPNMAYSCARILDEGVRSNRFAAHDICYASVEERLRADAEARALAQAEAQARATAKEQARAVAEEQALANAETGVAATASGTAATASGGEPTAPAKRERKGLFSGVADFVRTSFGRRAA